MDMPFDPRNATIFRTFRVPQELRDAMNARRKAKKMTVRDYVQHAIETELAKLVISLERELPSQAGARRRPARLPMTEELLAKLRKASQQTGVPSSRLLLACLTRAARAKRRK